MTIPSVIFAILLSVFPSMSTSFSTPSITTSLTIPSIPLPSFLTQSKRSKLKAELLDLCQQTQRGLNETEDQQELIQNLFIQLEQLNPTTNPLTSSNPTINSLWSLEYTTSASILGKGGFPRVGPIIQSIDTTTLSAENSEVVSYFGMPVARKVTAALSPTSTKFTNVQFEQFSIGPINIKAPESFKGSLDVTYLDEDLRLTRGDKGNIFVLTRMED